MFARPFTALLALLLAACGEQNDSQSASTSGSQTEPAPALSPAAEQGRADFGPCAVCHSVREGDNARVGPSLYGVYGREAGSLDGFAYSQAMAEAEFVWNEETLSAFIENPQKFLRGNRMAFVGERDAETRAAIIAYLKTLGPADDGE